MSGKIIGWGKVENVAEFLKHMEEVFGDSGEWGQEADERSVCPLCGECIENNKDATAVAPGKRGHMSCFNALPDDKKENLKALWKK